LHIPARMRRDGGWHDVTICNVSSRGLMAKCWAAPNRGDIVELRHGSTCIVGQVRWSGGGRFGLRSQDRIDLRGLLTGRPAAAVTEGGDRRARTRTAAPSRSAEEIAEHSRRLARLFDWCVVTVVVMGVGLLVADIAGRTLGAPLAQARAALEGPPPGD